MSTRLHRQDHAEEMKKMKPTTANFFLRGGFSSSQWNCTKRIDDGDIEESFYELEPILHDFDLFTSHYRSKITHQSTKCGVSA